MTSHRTWPVGGTEGPTGEYMDPRPRTRLATPMAHSFDGRIVFLALGCISMAPGCATPGGTTAEPLAEAAAPARIVQPGAPGEDARVYRPEELAAVEGVSYTEADVAFLHGMIPHHAQALDMTALVDARTTNPALRQMALRMEISQRDEIALMESWLRDHGEPTRMPMHGGMMPHMPGMLTAAQMQSLRDASGEDFDRRFLELMIQHHEGAIFMVDRLFATPGAGQESTIFKFASEVDADQTMEIERMQFVLAGLGR